MSSVSRKGSKRRRRGRLPRWLLIFYALLVIGFIGAGLVTGTFLGYEFNLPKIQSLEDYRPDVITDVYSDDNKVIGEFAVERRIIVGYEEIPPYFINALLAAEDDQFFNHHGINYFSVLRAAYRDLVHLRKTEGASTISMQLARMLLHNLDRTWDRKIKEILVTLKIERRYSKRQILTLYCNLHPMGHGAYGVAAAADIYFGKQARDLTLEESALLSGLPRSPALYSPRLHPDAALRRRNYILDRMVAEKMISPKLAAEAKSRPIILRPRLRGSETPQYFLEWVRQSLADKYTTDTIWRKGLRVYTSLNIGMQQAATRSLRDGLREYDKRHGWRGPLDRIFKVPSANLENYTHPDWRIPPKPGDVLVGLVIGVADSRATVRIGKLIADIGPKEIAWTRAKSPSEILRPGDLAAFQILSVNDSRKTASVLLDQIPEVQGALITIQNQTGEIKTMVGGYDFDTSEFNRATQAMRQAGSTFKPLVYSAALERGMTPDDTIIDSPISFTDALGRVWRPANYDGKFKGTIPLRQALAESRNVPTVKIASLIGIRNVLIMARRFGLSGKMEPYLPLALGASEATPLEMATAFSVFPNLGLQAKPYFIRRIEDYDHGEKEEHRPQSQRVLSPEIAAQMLNLLEGVVQNGTAQAAKSLGRPIGGKTGTTNDFTDAWFVGFTPSLTTAVWVGYDAKISLGNKEAGALAALPIWIHYIDAIYKDRPVEKFATVEVTNQITSSETGVVSPLERKKIFVEELPGTTPVKRP